MQIAIDPGKHTAAFALFEDGKLMHAAWVCVTDSKNCQPHIVAELLDKAVDPWIAEHGWRVTTARIEIPKHYDIAHQKGDQKDIRDVALVAGACAYVCNSYEARVELIEPWEWKGQIPKNVTKARVDLVLTPEELAQIEWPKQASKRHNIYDAIHMGLRAFTTRKA